MSKNPMDTIIKLEKDVSRVGGGYQATLTLLTLPDEGTAVMLADFMHDLVSTEFDKSNGMERMVGFDN